MYSARAMGSLRMALDATWTQAPAVRAEKICTMERSNDMDDWWRKRSSGTKAKSWCSVHSICCVLAWLRTTPLGVPVLPCHACQLCPYMYMSMLLSKGAPADVYTV